MDPLAVRLPRPYVPHTPFVPQHVFLALDELGIEEALYGGAAGGGKSDALLTAALKYVDIPGYAALLLRKSYSDLALPGAIMDRSKEWLHETDARWSEVDKKWTFPTGATLSFGYLQSANDKYRYQGAEFQMVGFDELTQFDETDYRYLLSRLRRPSEGPLSHVPLRMRAATNPGGRGHRWVKRRFIDQLSDPDDPVDTPTKARRRVFIPAKLRDNPATDRAAYAEKLAGLDPQTRAQLLDGDWNAREPGDWVFPTGLDQVFALGNQHRQMRDTGEMPPPVGQQLVLSADWGVHSHLLLLWPLEMGGFHVAREFVYTGGSGSVRRLARPVQEGIRDLGWPVYTEPFDSSMPEVNAAFLEDLNALSPTHIKFLKVPFSKYKVLTIDYLKLLVDNTRRHQLGDLDALPPYLSIDERGCPVLAEQIRQWRYADADAGRIEKQDDHGPDSLVAGAAHEAARSGRVTNPTLERARV